MKFGYTHNLYPDDSNNSPGLIRFKFPKHHSKNYIKFRPLLARHPLHNRHVQIFMSVLYFFVLPAALI